MPTQGQEGHTVIIKNILSDQQGGVKYDNKKMVQMFTSEHMNAFEKHQLCGGSIKAPKM